MRVQTARGAGDLTPELLSSTFWSDAMVESAGIPIRDVPFVTVGGGIGSFVMIDYLRIAGVPASRLCVLSNIDYPWQTYEYLTRVSQIPKPERIRSDSSSRPDNIWGFPSYALAETWRDRSLRHLAHVLIEPVFADYWTPRAGTVFTSLERECKRIGYQEMLVKGIVRMVRRRVGGGYFTILTPPAADLGKARRGEWRSGRGARVPQGQARHGRDPGRRHRRLPRAAAPPRRPEPVRDADEDRAHLPYLRHRRARPARLDAPQGRRRVGLSGFQLSQVGVGWSAQGPDAQTGRRRAIKGTASGDGALYASGATTLGGYFPGVDTFLGLQVAAQEIADDLARRGWCHRIGPLRSTAQWLNWALNRPV